MSSICLSTRRTSWIATSAMMCDPDITAMLMGRLWSSPSTFIAKVALHGRIDLVLADFSGLLPLHGALALAEGDDHLVPQLQLFFAGLALRGDGPLTPFTEGICLRLCSQAISVREPGRWFTTVGSTPTDRPIELLGDEDAGASHRNGIRQALAIEVDQADVDVDLGGHVALRGLVEGEPLVALVWGPGLLRF